MLLGGAALTRAYVEEDLSDVYDGTVRYARDAFEGLRLMDTVMAVKSGREPAEALLPKARTRPRTKRVEPEAVEGGRSDVATDVPIPTPPFWGDRVVRGIQLADYASYLDERATFLGQWGLRAARGGEGPSYEELVETEGRPRLRAWLERLQAEKLLEAGVVYGYYRAVSKDDDLIVLGENGDELTRFTFPRQRRDRRLCLADYFRPQESGEIDVVGFQVVTMGPRVSEATAKLFAEDAYRDYLELHGLSVQLAEALAEYWHFRVRQELGIVRDDPPDLDGLLKVAVPRRPLLARLRRLPEPRGPGEDHAAAEAGAHRSGAVGGVAAASRAVDRRDHRAPPGGVLLQRSLSREHETVDRGRGPGPAWARGIAGCAAPPR